MFLTAQHLPHGSLFPFELILCMYVCVCHSRFCCECSQSLYTVVHRFHYLFTLASSILFVALLQRVIQREPVVMCCRLSPLLCLFLCLSITCASPYHASEGGHVRQPPGIPCIRAYNSLYGAQHAVASLWYAAQATRAQSPDAVV